jgi:CRP/FNR family transcriptional regulator, cyclic AMP receptor protein
MTLDPTQTGTAAATTRGVAPARGGDEIATLKGIPLFGTMDDQELRGLRAVMEAAAFGPGQTIIREGDEGKYFYVILSGNVQYLSMDASGQELVLDEAGPGSFFGELSMLTGEKRLVRVRSADEVSTLTLNRDQFHDFLVKHPHAAIDVLTAISRRLYTMDKMLRQSVSRNVNEEMEDKKTIGQVIADGFASMMGSWTFIILQSAILVLWIGINAMAALKVIHWDEYPFTFLNLALSFEAAYAAPIIMMSQNRSADKDRLSAEIDHQVNVKAEVKTGQIMSRLDDMEREMHFLHAELLRHIRLHAPPTGNGAPAGDAAGR